MNQRWQAAMLVCLLLAGCQTGESGSNGAAGSSGQPPESAVHSSDHQQGKTSESPVDPDLQLEAKYWNIVEVQNGQKVIKNPDNILVLVNKEQSLPPGYKPADLVVPRVPFLCADPNAEKRHMRAEAAAALEEMFAAARRDGIELVAVSAYRSYERQQVIFAEEVRQKREGKTRFKRSLTQGRASIRQGWRSISAAARPAVS